MPLPLHTKHVLVLTHPCAPGQGEPRQDRLEVYARCVRSSVKHRLGKLRLVLTWADYDAYIKVKAALSAKQTIYYPAGKKQNCQIVGVTLDPRAKIPAPKKTRPRRWGESSAGKTRSPKFKGVKDGPSI